MNKNYLLLLILCWACTKNGDIIENEEENCIPNYSNNYLQESFKTRTNYLHQDYQNAIQQNGGWHGPMEAVVLDYDLDGNADFVHGNSNYPASFEGDVIAARQKIQFFKGNCEGRLTNDFSLSNRFDGPIHGRKGLVGDFNNDTYPDIFLAGHGTDAPPFSMEYPILLINEGGQDFKEVRFENLIGFWHSATSGDYDNDGDLDIVLYDISTPYLMENNGDATFQIFAEKDGYQSDLIIEKYPTKDLVELRVDGVFTLEMFDINGDGFLDLITSGHDYENFPSPSKIHYGDGNGFTAGYADLPTSVGFGICIDIDFYDINGDGHHEIIMNRAGDPKNGNCFYCGWNIQILELEGNEYIDRTAKYIENYNEPFTNNNWLYWIDIRDYDGDGVVELYNDDLDDNPNHLSKEWELVGEKFITVR
jgi:hypothetical protein